MALERFLSILTCAALATLSVLVMLPTDYEMTKYLAPSCLIYSIVLACWLYYQRSKEKCKKADTKKAVKLERKLKRKKIFIILLFVFLFVAACLFIATQVGLIDSEFWTIFQDKKRLNNNP